MTTVWLSPVNETIPDDFGYSVTGYFDLRADSGTKEDFRALVRRAHALGMHVIMDFVPDLDFDNPRVDDMVIDALEYWVRDFDVDGHRLDVAWGVKARDPGLWPRVRTALEQLKPTVLLVANWDAQARSVRVTPPDGFRGALRDELSEEPVSARACPEGLTLELPAWGVRVLVPAK